MKQRVFFALIMFCCFFQLQAQKYNTAIGLRMGDEFGYSLKQRVFNKVTAEFIYQDGLITNQQFASAMLQQHHNLLGKRFNLYLGAGYFKSWEPSGVSDDPLNIQTGIPLIIGGEFTIGRINISTDVMPIYYLTGDNKTSFSKRSGISIRYVFWKRKRGISKLWKKIRFWK